MFVAAEYAGKDRSVQAHFSKKSEQELLGYENSGKLLGLYEKLVECEIIYRDDEIKGSTEETVMLDISSNIRD